MLPLLLRLLSCTSTTLLWLLCGLGSTSWCPRRARKSRLEWIRFGALLAGGAETHRELQDTRSAGGAADARRMLLLAYAAGARGVRVLA